MTGPPDKAPGGYDLMPPPVPYRLAALEASMEMHDVLDEYSNEVVLKLGRRREQAANDDMSARTHIRANDYEFADDPYWKSALLWVKGVKTHFLLVDDDLKYCFKSKNRGGIFEDCVKTKLLKRAAAHFLGLQHGIFLLDGSAWLATRKSLSHLFSASVLRSRLKPAMRAKTRVLVDRFSGNEDARVVDLGSSFRLFALDLITSHAFGLDLNSLEERALPAYMKAFDALHREAYDRSRSLSVFLGLDVLLASTGLFPGVGDALNDVVRTDIFDAWFADEDNHSPMRAVVLRSAAASGLDEAQTKTLAFQYMKTILLAGADTTSEVMTWLAIELFHEDTIDPDLLLRLRAEAVAATSENENPLLEACILETLRLHPPVPRETRVYTGLRAHTLPSGLVIFPGDLIAYHPEQKNRSATRWQDPLEFRPERWTGKKLRGHEMPTFNVGRRECLGRALAMSEIRYVFGEILKAGAHRFRFAKSRRDLRHDTRGFVTRPVDSVYVSVVS